MSPEERAQELFGPVDAEVRPRVTEAMVASAIAEAEREARARAMEDAAKAYQDAAGRVALLVALLREYQGFNRIHDDSEADIYARGGALLTMPPVPITLARALASSGSGGSEGP